MLEQAIIDINKLEGLCKYQDHIVGCNCEEREENGQNIMPIVFKNIHETRIKCVGCPHTDFFGDGDVEIIDAKGRIMACPYNPRFRS